MTPARCRCGGASISVECCWVLVQAGQLSTDLTYRCALRSEPALLIIMLGPWYDDPASGTRRVPIRSWRQFTGQLSSYNPRRPEDDLIVARIAAFRTSRDVETAAPRRWYGHEQGGGGIIEGARFCTGGSPADMLLLSLAQP